MRWLFAVKNVDDVLNPQMRQWNLEFVDFALENIVRIRQNVLMVLHAKDQIIIVINVNG